MKIKSLRVTASLVLGLLCAAANAQYIDFEVQGKKFSNSYDIHYAVPLPKGEWTGVRGNEYTVTIRDSNPKFREVVLSNIENNNLNMSVYLKAKVDDISARWLDEPCKGEDFIYKNDYGTNLWKQRCLTIRASEYLQKADNKMQQISRDFYAKMNLKHPYNNLQVNITQYDSNGRFLQIQFYVFPNNYGLENPLVSVMAASPWHLSNYKADPKKVKFIESLKVWAEKYSDVLYQSYSTGKNNLTEVPAFTWRDE